jgi:hypothetical protein
MAMNNPDVPETGRFKDTDPDIYTRARKFVESGGETPAATPKTAAPKPAPKAAAPKSPAAPAPKASPSYTPRTMSQEEVVAAGRKEAIKPDTTVEETLMGGKALKAAAAGVGRMMGRSAAPASVSREVATKYDKITPIPNRAARTMTQGIESRGAAGPALPSPGSAPRVGGPAATPRVSAQSVPSRLPSPAPSAPAAAKPKPPMMKAKPKAAPAKPRANDAMNKAIRSRSPDDMYAKGGMVKATPKATKYACGGMVKATPKSTKR